MTKIWHSAKWASVMSRLLNVGHRLGWICLWISLSFFFFFFKNNVDDAHQFVRLFSTLVPGKISLTLKATYLCIFSVLIYRVNPWSSFPIVTRNVYTRHHNLIVSLLYWMNHPFWTLCMVFFCTSLLFLFSCGVHKRNVTYLILWPFNHTNRNISSVWLFPCNSFSS